MRMTWTVAALIMALGTGQGQDYPQVERLRRQAKAAFDREMVREKAGTCEDARSTYAINTCLSKENQTSSANYKEFSGAIGALLASGGQKEFNHAQAAWEDYSQAQCSAAFELYRGGTIALSTELGCNLTLLRSHMRELETVYHGTLNY